MQCVRKGKGKKREYLAIVAECKDCHTFTSKKQCKKHSLSISRLKKTLISRRSQAKEKALDDFLVSENNNLFNLQSLHFFERYLEFVEHLAEYWAMPIVKQPDCTPGCDDWQTQWMRT